MGLRGEELTIDGRRFSPEIEGSLTAATLTRAMDSATSLSLTISDPEMLFLVSGALTRQGNPSTRQQEFDQAAWSRFAAGRLNLDGISFRLAGDDGDYDVAPWSNTITVEDELATVMRLANKAIKTSRGDRTRAEFIGMLVRGALAREQVPFSRALQDRFYSPQAGQRQPIKQPDDDGRTKGIHHLSGLTVKGEPMSSEQRGIAETALTVADQLKAGERATTALLDALITESQIRNLTGGTGSSQGPLQVTAETAAGIAPQTVIDPRTGQVHGAVTHDATGPIAPGKLNPRDVKGVVRVFLLHGYAGNGGAIAYAAKNPDAEIYEIAQAVQGSGAGQASNGRDNYGPWVNEAAAILDAWGGVGSLQTIRESFEFRAGGKRNGETQNYFDDSGDLANDVNWRRFVDRNRVWFVNDAWLFERMPLPQFVLDGENWPRTLAEQGLIGGPRTRMDIGLPVAEITINAFVPRWGAPPGGTVVFRNAGAITGKWLIWSSTQDLLAPHETAQMVLRRPAPQKAEPAPGTKTIQRTETKPDAGTARDLIVKAAEKALREKSRYFYLQSRPMPASLFPDDRGLAPASLLGIDCSAFATLVYKAAGVDDPNGLGYNGAGNTDTLIANGKRTNDPQPGDLLFFRDPDHVAVYIGDNECIEIGGRAGVSKLDVRTYRRADQIGYYTYDLG